MTDGKGGSEWWWFEFLVVVVWLGIYSVGKGDWLEVCRLVRAYLLIGTWEFR